MASANYSGAPHVPVDTFINGDLGRAPAAGKSARLYDAHLVEAEDLGPPAWRQRKIKPCPKAIANLDALPRPLAPPGKRAA